MIKTLMVKIASVLLLITLQYSLLNMLFPSIEIPILIVDALVSIVLVFGFREGIGLWLSLLVGYDLLRIAHITYLLPTGILIAYAVSFISRRYIFEHRGFGLFFLAGVALLAGIGYKIAALVVVQENTYQLTTLVALCSLSLFFPPIFVSIQWIEMKIQDMQRSEFRELKRSSV